MVREVAESCVESLLTEIVSQYCNGIYANKPDLAARRIEAIGYQVGHQLSERYTMERPRFSDHLEAIKFICKDFWSELFKKQIDNLKTNHKGTFVLQDSKFRWLSRVSIAPSSANSGSIQDPSAMAESKEAQATGMYLYFPCGIIRGALSNLGIPCAVSADISNLPACFACTQGEDEQEGDTEASKGIQREGEELHKDSKRESREGPSVLLQRPPQQEAGHALPLD
ncbi:hypothetical protein RHGRI_014634 [Rhododendron griersonianum]|uniref:Trafficking protein particle complex subunit 6B n=2 Tax=Rhododendron griersonianum TaxID=479676 RepID=A0AAV6KA56_9ERIC|nr:hypothetical protein RHGRI_014634 [Rhododendron griersonianum]